MDYSLQLADGLESALFYGNPNPCQAMAMELRMAVASGKDTSRDRRMVADRLRRMPLDREVVRRLNRADQLLHRR
jgi:hypothetical protein